MKLETIVQSFPQGRREALIPVLQEVQSQEGYISRDAVQHIGSHLKVPAAKIYGVATFYNQFRFEPKGKYHIQLCRGTACHVRGSSTVLDSLSRLLKLQPGQTASDGVFSLEVVACIGACGLAPVISINNEFHAAVSSEKLQPLLKGYRKRAASESAGRSNGGAESVSNGSGS